jgi:glycosyltransferase involved in cell wall biosynthesis
LLPCYNEEAAVGNVIAAFRRELPNATIYVYDNNSTDSTMEKGRNARAIVSPERLQGKGHAIRRMFADIGADAYLLADGDDTYEASSAPDMVRMLFAEQLDMVTGTRVTKILLVCGLILDSVSRGRKEFKRMMYMSIPRFR